MAKKKTPQGRNVIITSINDKVKSVEITPHSEEDPDIKIEIQKSSHRNRGLWATMNLTKQD